LDYSDVINGMKNPANTQTGKTGLSLAMWFSINGKNLYRADI